MKKCRTCKHLYILIQLGVVPIGNVSTNTPNPDIH